MFSRHNNMRSFNMRAAALTLALPFAFTLESSSHYHTDQYAQAIQITMTLQAEKPIGTILIAYDKGKDKKSKPSLKIKCDLFTSSAPTPSLTDLLCPDLHNIQVLYSPVSNNTSSFDLSGPPYLYVRIPLLGATKSWRNTWVTLHFDEKGTFTKRMFKRFLPESETHIRSFWAPWPIDKNITAQEMYAKSEPAKQ